MSIRAFSIFSDSKVPLYRLKRETAHQIRPNIQSRIFPRFARAMYRSRTFIYILTTWNLYFIRYCKSKILSLGICLRLVGSMNQLLREPKWPHLYKWYPRSLLDKALLLMTYSNAFLRRQMFVQLTCNSCLPKDRKILVSVSKKFISW